MRLLAALALSGAVLAAQAAERSLDLGNGKAIRYSVVDPAAPDRNSALATAMQVVRLLAAGKIEEVAALSNAPERRLEVLRDYRASVGDAEFRRVFAQFLSPENRVVAEVAMGPRRLVIWDLGEASHHLSGQYFVEAGDAFLIDDVPSEARADLRRVLQSYRKERPPRPSGQKD